MKQIETFFELSNYDSKNITNKGPQTIPQNALNKIESEGVTLEFLNALNVPVFKYKTQITIHGLFPELHNNYLGGYKNLWQNKNLSIGVKWQAVDYAKKDHIYSTVIKFSGWSRSHNSTDFFIYKTSKHFTDKETYKTLLDEAKNEIAHIDKSLFFGNCGVYLSCTPYGSYYLVTYINIGGILQSNVNPCIENICKASIKEIETKFADMKAVKDKEDADRKAKCEIEIAEKKAKQAPLMESARQVLKDAGYTLNEKAPIEIDTIYIKIETDISTGNFHFIGYKYSKEARQKKFRYVKATSDNLIFDFPTASYLKNETIQTTVTGWSIPKAKIQAPETPLTPQISSSLSQSNHTPIEGVKAVQYNEKSIALFGNTYPIKDKIKAQGGRFNKFLKIDGQITAGWIFSNLNNFANQYLTQ